MKRELGGGGEKGAERGGLNKRGIKNERGTAEIILDYALYEVLHLIFSRNEKLY